MNKRPLVPSFLQQLDDKLLRNKPNTWAARTHLVAWFAFLFALVLSGFCFLAFFDPKEYVSLGSWAGFIAMIAFIGFVFWLIYLLRFNVFKRYGNWFEGNALKSFGLYFISIGCIVAVCFIPSGVASLRANQKFSDAELIRDINEINVTACKLEHGLLPLDWKADTIKLIDRDASTLQSNTAPADVAADTIATSVLPRYEVMDKAELRTKLAATDSVVKITDSLYVFYDCPDYTFINVYYRYRTKYIDNRLLSSAEIYHSILKNFKREDPAPLVKRMGELKEKYSARSQNPYEYDFDGNYSINDTYDTKIKKKYGLYSMNTGFDNILAKKYAWIEDWDSYLRVFYYVTMTLTLLVFIFRHTTVKTFFLSLLTAVIFSILSGLIMAMSYNTESLFFSLLIVYYIVFFGTALSIHNMSVRNAVSGIALNLAVFMTPFIPLIFVGLNYTMHRYDYYGENGRNYYEPDHTERNIFIAEIAGVVLFLVLLQFVFKKLYRKWYAAPED